MVPPKSVTLDVGLGRAGPYCLQAPAHVSVPRGTFVLSCVTEAEGVG